jgi:hypothetical protein
MVKRETQKSKGANILGRREYTVVGKKAGDGVERVDIRLPRSFNFSP